MCYICDGCSYYISTCVWHVVLINWWWWWWWWWWRDAHRRTVTKSLRCRVQLTEHACGNNSAMNTNVYGGHAVTIYDHPCYQRGAADFKFLWRRLWPWPLTFDLSVRKRFYRLHVRRGTSALHWKFIRPSLPGPDWWQRLRDGQAGGRTDGRRRSVIRPPRGTANNSVPRT